MLVRIYAVASVLALAFGLLAAPIAGAEEQAKQETDSPSVDAPPPIEEEAKSEGEMEEEHEAEETETED